MTTARLPKSVRKGCSPSPPLGPLTLRRQTCVECKGLTPENGTEQVLCEQRKCPAPSWRRLAGRASGRHEPAAAVGSPRRQQAASGTRGGGGTKQARPGAGGSKRVSSQLCAFPLDPLGFPRNPEAALAAVSPCPACEFSVPHLRESLGPVATRP